MKLISTMVFVLLLIITVYYTQAKSNWVSQIPNGNINSCTNCHVSMSNYSTNKFGKTIENGYLSNNKVTWGSALANIDSDEDGFTNGAELQDSGGLWKSGDANPGITGNVTNPGSSSSVPTGVIEDLIINGFSISSVSPNPFYNSVSINCSVNVPGMIRAGIYDNRGNLIKNLLFDEVEPDNYIFQWDGRDNFDNKVQSGVYYLMLSKNNNTAIKQIIFIR